MTNQLDSDKSILVLAGDGIGPECVNEALKIIGWFHDKLKLKFSISEDLVGGAAYDTHGTSLTDKTLEKAKNVDAILFGSVGGPKWDKVERHNRPENGLLQLRKKLDLFANLRPANVFPSLANSSSIKPEIISDLDIMIVRELTSGVYFGEPKKIIELTDGIKQAVDTQTYNSIEIARVARTAFEIARKRQNRLCSVEKSNVMETGVLWREVVTEIHNAEYPDVSLSHMLADACAMELIRKPKQFDTIVTDNLFGDMLSDEASMLTGSIGMLPSASIGVRNHKGKLPGLYEPIHGSAPDIAGKNIANPIAEILSLAMMFHYSFDLKKESELLTKAISNCLKNGMRTKDIHQSGTNEVSTKEMTNGIINELTNLIH